MRWIRRINWYAVGLLALFLAVWQAVAAWGRIPDYLLPSPAEVGGAIATGWTSRMIPVALVVTFRRIAIGFGLSLVAGVGLGLALARVRWLGDAVRPVVLGLQALPSICWFPVALLWFGLSEAAILFVTIAGALFAMTVATDSGVRTIPPIYVRAARTMGARGMRLMWRVILPASFPAIVSGMRQAWSLAWRSLMAGELLFVNLGLGHLLTVGRELNDMSQVLAVVLIILLLGLVVDRLVFSRVETSVHRRWGLGLSL